MHPLTRLAALRFTGPDARSFLQGQLSNDLTLLTPEKPLLAACNSAQGRVQAILRLVERPNDMVALLPRSLCEVIANRLRKYQLRAKLSIDVATSLSISSTTCDELQALGLPTPDLGASNQAGAVTALRWPDAATERYVLLHEQSLATEASMDGDWLLADIRAGLPQVLPETYESFVAQMLNLEELGAISFNKGCYTGQEIIARAHFRGTVKRTMVRYAANCSAPLPGTRIVVGAEAAGEVVMAADCADGCELLAVVSLPQQGLELTLAGTTAALKPLSLPYKSVTTE